MWNRRKGEGDCGGKEATGEALLSEFGYHAYHGSDKDRRSTVELGEMISFGLGLEDSGTWCARSATSSTVRVCSAATAAVCGHSM